MNEGLYSVTDRLWEAESKDRTVSDGVGFCVQELGWSKHMLWNVGLRACKV